MRYGYFVGLSWWPWILAAAYTALMVLFFQRQKTTRFIWLVFCGPVVFLFEAMIEIANTGILVGRGSWDVVSYFADLFIVGAVTSLFTGIFLGSMLGGLDNMRKEREK